MLSSLQAYEKSSTYKFIKDIQEISQPLNKLGVKYFVYAELRGCYYLSCLVNNDNMVRSFINHHGLKYEIALSPYKVINKGLYSLASIAITKEIKNYYAVLFTLHNAIDQIFYIVDEHNVRKVYIFGVEHSLYVSKEYLDLFILYFHDKAHHLINLSEPFEIPTNFLTEQRSLNIMAQHSLIASIEEDFLHSINAKYYKIKQLQARYALSNREVQCLELILQHKLNKEIADCLRLTTRTAETYVDHLRKKLNCHSRSEILVKFFIR